MGEFTKLTTKSELPNGKMKEFHLHGKTIVVVNTDGEMVAFDGICTHAQCALAGGFLDGYTLTCYCHGAQFDIQKGKVISPPATSPLKVYKVKIEGEDILIEV